ncbi:hypothetical protein ACLOJK_018353 [Asimina triloba]
MGADSVCSARCCPVAHSQPPLAVGENGEGKQIWGRKDRTMIGSVLQMGAVWMRMRTASAGFRRHQRCCRPIVRFMLPGCSADGACWLPIIRTGQGSADRPVLYEMGFDPFGFRHGRSEMLHLLKARCWPWRTLPECTCPVWVGSS